MVIVIYMDYGKKSFRTYFFLYVLFNMLKCYRVINMEKITLKEFDEVYALFEKAFIPAELRPYEKMKLLFLEDEFVIYGMYQDGRIIGAIIVWEFNDFVYLENFAVDQSLRGQGLGSQILQAIKELYPHQLLVLEVEEPIDDLTKRRVAFYQRNQYVLNPYHFVQPPLRKNALKVELMYMSYPDSINVYAFDQIKKQIFRIVYQQGI